MSSISLADEEDLVGCECVSSVNRVWECPVGQSVELQTAVTVAGEISIEHMNFNVTLK